MEHGHVLRDFLSQEGVKQGDALASLLFALSMKKPYADSVEGLGCHAIAIMDDCYFFGPPDPTFEAFDRFAIQLPDTGLMLNRVKSIALLPSAAPRYLPL